MTEDQVRRSFDRPKLLAIFAMLLLTALCAGGYLTWLFTGEDRIVQIWHFAVIVAIPAVPSLFLGWRISRAERLALANMDVVYE